LAYELTSGNVMNVVVPLAAVAEMCDRTYAQDWSLDLEATLVRTASIGRPQQHPSQKTDVGQCRLTDPIPLDGGCRTT